MDDAGAPNETRDALRADAPAPGSDNGKTIILFSDGTGNSSATLFKTNVFRLYQALDLGPDREGRTPQIAYYDNGVGTSSIRLFAILGGVFGFGLKRNILHLYRFLCRNYNPGDRIYAFGFSRGAFTIRLLIGLICTQGIVPYRDERELHYNSADALYRFVDLNGPDKLSWFWLAMRFLRNAVRLGWRRLRGRPVDVPVVHRPDVEFVGVWDTVAAYGGPISEITRGIDQYVWPLTMTDYILHPKVRAARHALAIDDERDSFWPLLWDEVSEERNAAAAATPEARAHFEGRMQQVWFAGMHADVGGGYPDDSLAYVSLVWMMDEIGDGLRFLPDEERRIRGFANAFGPMHDSRAGLGHYYRYQPRKIAVMLHRTVPDTLGYHETLMLRDPTVGEKQYRPQGLLTACRVHASVIQRIGAGSDNYAPIALPRDFTIVPPPGTVAKADAGDAVFLSEAAVNLRKPDVAAARGEAQENGWDLVWHRRIGYFTVVALTLLLVATPVLFGDSATAPVEDARSLSDIVISWIGFLLPSFAEPWLGAFQRHERLFLMIGIAIAAVSYRMNVQAQRLGDRSRIAWWEALGGTPPRHAGRSRLRRFRTHRLYQWPLQTLKWRIMPFLVGLLIMPVLPLYLGAVIGTQYRLIGLERDVFCTDRPTLSPGPVVRLVLRADAPCTATGLQVTPGHRYRVVLSPDDPAGWRDGRHAVPIGGQRSFSFPWHAMPLMTAAVPFRRVLPAGWLEPIVAIRSPAVVVPGAGPSRIAMLRLQLRRPPQNDPRLVGEFIPAREGGLHLFLNDAVGPWGDPAFFYDGSDQSRNRGTAQVCIEDLEQRPPQGGRFCGVRGWSGGVTR